MSLEKVAVTGGTGFVGQRLVSQLKRPIVLTRSPEKHRLEQLNNTTADSPIYSKWDSDQLLDPSVLSGIKSIVHLAGEPIASGRWTTDKKQRIRDSRVIGTRCLVRSLAKMEVKPDVLVSASAVGFYGNRPKELLDEHSDAGEGFLAHVCEEWEAEAIEAESLGIRVCRVRLGIILDPNEGALEKMLPFFRLGIAGPLGSGRQYFPWVHIDDVIGILVHCLNNKNVSGPINAVAPESLSNRQFTKRLGHAIHRPTLLPVPKFGLKVLYGEFAESLFDDQHVKPKVAVETGYRFQFPNLADALRNLL